MAVLYQKIQKRDKTEGMEILGYEGKIRHLTVPEEIENIPVQRIGKSAFSGREDLVSVQLPQTVDTLGRYAFYNCKNLKSLCLYDGVEDYYDGVIKQCRQLSEVTLIQTRNDFSVMKEMLADNDRMLRFVVEPLGLHLTFPAYVYDFVEDVEARVLHHKIEGSGYPSRECVTRKGVDILAYDRLFQRVIADDYPAAISIALDRLMYPLELEQGMREEYEQYLEQNGSVVIRELIPAGENQKIAYLCENCLLQREVAEEALYLASEEKQSGIAAVLMEYQREHFTGRMPAQALTLDDW